MWKTIEVDTSVGPVGAIISGVDLSEELDEEVVSEIHQAWLKHHIVFFRDQDLTPHTAKNLGPQGFHLSRNPHQR